MITIVAGSRNCTDYDLVSDTIQRAEKELDIKITTIVSGGARGIDKTAEKYAKENGINLVVFPADWGDINDPDAIVKERINPWTKKKEKYNANAGFARNEKMAKYSEALVAVDLGTAGTKDMISRAKKHGLKIHTYQPEPIQPLTEFGYNFWSDNE